MKKILAIALVIALLSTLAIGSTLSYFKDTAYDKNVMTVGTVTIEQIELGGDGLEFQDQKMYPAVILEAEDHVIPKVNGLWKDAAINNEITKIVTVKNTGSEDAYIRTIFAFETGEIYNEGTDVVNGYIHDKCFGWNGTMTFLEENGVPVMFTIGDTKYALAVCTYADPVKSGKTTDSSLRQFFLSPDVGNDFYGLIDGKYDILVLSQGVQTEGFTGAENALNTAFGAVTAENAQAWFTAHQN